MEFCTKAVLDTMYVNVMEYGIDNVAKMIKNGYYEQFYRNNKTKDGKEILSWLKEYNDLVLKYYSTEEK